MLYCCASCERRPPTVTLSLERLGAVYLRCAFFLMSGVHGWFGMCCILKKYLKSVCVRL